MQSVYREIGTCDFGFALFAAGWIPYPVGLTALASLVENGFHFYYLKNQAVPSSTEFSDTDCAVFVPNVRRDDPGLCLALVRRFLHIGDQGTIMYMPHDKPVVIVEDVRDGNQLFFDRADSVNALAAFEQLRKGMCSGPLQGLDVSAPLYDCIQVPLSDAGIGCSVIISSEIIDLVRNEPGILNAELKRRLPPGDESATASYYLRKAGILVAEKAGSTFRLTLADDSMTTDATVNQFCKLMVEMEIRQKQGMLSDANRIRAGVTVVPDAEVIRAFEEWYGHQRMEATRQEYIRAVRRCDSRPSRRDCTELFGWWSDKSWTAFVKQKLAHGVIFQTDETTQALLHDHLGKYVSTAVRTHYQHGGFFAYTSGTRIDGIPDDVTRELAAKLRANMGPIRADRMLYHEYQVIEHFLSHSRFELGVPLDIHIRECMLCGDDFLGDFSPVVDALPPGASFVGFPVCADCIGFTDVCSIRKTKDHLIADLQALVEMIGYLPASRFKDARLLKSLSHENYIRALGHLQQMAGFEITDPRVPHRAGDAGTYREVFGTWLNTCVAAGLLDQLNERSPRGIRCIARDGHECNSLGEKAVDDWLFSRGIEHEKEPEYPFHDTLNPFRMRADWKVGDTYVELWGMIGDEGYDAKIRRKNAVVEHFGISVIELTPADIVDGLAKLNAALFG